MNREELERLNARAQADIDQGWKSARAYWEDLVIKKHISLEEARQINHCFQHAGRTFCPNCITQLLESRTELRDYVFMLAALAWTELANRVAVGVIEGDEPDIANELFED